MSRFARYMATVFANVKTLYYTAGVENVAWISVTEDVGASATKEAGDIRLQAAYTSVATAAAVRTTAKVDLTAINTLYFDCENAGTDTNNNIMYLLVGSGADDNPGAGYNARVETRRTFARQIKTLDVSSLSGEYYIRVIALANFSDSTCDVKVYNVWGV